MLHFTENQSLYDVLKSWCNALEYMPNDIFLVYIKENNIDKYKTSTTPKVHEDSQCIIKELSTIQNSDIDTSIQSNKQLILHFDKQISLTSLSILSHANYRYLYFDLMHSNSSNPLYTFQRINPEGIVQNNIAYIKNFFYVFLNNHQSKKSIFRLNQINTLLLRDKKGITLETIQNDIKFLEHHNKLTSRLAIFIYKICTFEFNASEKEIGQYFSQFFGKSKSLNKKTYGIQNVKGYEVNIFSNDPIYNTKVQIAHTLSTMINEQINQNTILKATGIDINDIQGSQ